MTTEEIRVNFGRPMPLFPLEEFVLLPHAVQLLHVFEPRYTRMVGDCLDHAGQIAVATFDTAHLRAPETAFPPLKPVVCVGQIVQHESTPDGRYMIVLHGVCRAEIVDLVEPDDDQSMYRAAWLRPVEDVEHEPPAMLDSRDELRRLLSTPRLARLRGVENVMPWFEREEVTTYALLELIGFAVIQQPVMKYQLLAEPSPHRRAAMIKRELLALDRLVARADAQDFKSWPKGMSWN